MIITCIYTGADVASFRGGSGGISRVQVLATVVCHKHRGERLLLNVLRTQRTRVPGGHAFPFVLVGRAE